MAVPPLAPSATRIILLARVTERATFGSKEEIPNRDNTLKIRKNIIFFGITF